MAGNSLIVEKIIINKDKPENESRGSNKFVPKYFTWRFIDFVKEEIILEIDNKNRKNNYTAEEEEDDQQLIFMGLLFNEMENFDL